MKNFILNNKLFMVLFTPIILLLLIGGICNAYDAYLINSLEGSYSSNLKAIEAWQETGSNLKTACQKSYEALLAYKKENNIPIKGSGSSCFTVAIQVSPKL